MATTTCDCGTFAIGVCQQCQKLVCGHHSLLLADRRTCTTCARERRDAEKASHTRAVHEKRERRLALPEMDVTQLTQAIRGDKAVAEVARIGAPTGLMLAQAFRKAGVPPTVFSTSPKRRFGRKPATARGWLISASSHIPNRGQAESVRTETYIGADGSGYTLVTQFGRTASQTSVEVHAASTRHHVSLDTATGRRSRSRR